MIGERLGPSADMWSVGVFTYKLLCGYYPFRSEKMKDTRDEVRSGRIIFHEMYWKDISKAAKDFIIGLPPLLQRRVLRLETLYSMRGSQDLRSNLRKPCMNSNLSV
jgi:serine/threonine protein kinase